MKIILSHIIFILFCLHQFGCVAPIPVYHHDDESRRNIDISSSKKLILGTTTLEDILLKLGEPDLVLDSFNCIVYLNTRITAHWFWAIGYGYMGEVGYLGPSKTTNGLYIYFDDNEVVVKTEYR